MKRIVTIQDISCVGKCSATVVLPVLSAMGVEAALLPTAVLSTHTMFPHPAVLSLEDMIEPIMQHWLEEGVTFDAVYSGYLASKRQIGLVQELFEHFGSGDTIRIVDPAMADHGKLYSGFDADFPMAMAGLCAQADYILPNFTEACLMTGRDYCEVPDAEKIRELLDALAQLGTRRAVVITGVAGGSVPQKGSGEETDNCFTGASGLDLETGEYFEVRQEMLPVSFHGTGDLFAAVTSGALTKGMALREALQLAADFVHAAIRETVEHDPDKDKRFGVNFEPVLSMLTAL
ncbi:MAG: pyridoxamine kinase [Lachnospiraceae bacterium]|nr:pyridoxamine kinase [Lachnospiraceae bacterium]